ncbi:hypothetical protein [Halobellus sp. H-GB7]|uniref:hypothetical protein n=1 Tax=Halobellus sp. H-GB7 TaxID=3069756 RepID=UPI0027B6C10C|nr:hypothetical protein [Halobellus sp. H-GB7]MDQ2056323.1 hypothetical protein [Halobellus sp. H-GB7]
MTDDALTLRASGPALTTTETERDGVAIETTVTVDLEATLDVDADWLDEHATVCRSGGAQLAHANVARFVTETLSDAEAEYEPEDESEWDLRLSGSIEAWQAAVVPLAKRHSSRIASEDDVANAVCAILDDLSEHAASDRPQLALLDVLEDYDPDDYAKQNVLNALSATDSELTTEATPTAEVSADD